MELSTLSALTWVTLIAAAALTGLTKTAVPGLASVAAALFALVLPAKESTGVMLTLLLIGDMIALWAYRRDAVAAVLRRLVPSVLAGVGLGALLLAVSTQAQMRRTIGAILLLLVLVTLAQRRWGPPHVSQGRVARAAYGTLAGFTTMATNAGGPVTSMYFLASRFSVSQFLGTTAWVSSRSTSSRHPSRSAWACCVSSIYPSSPRWHPWCSRARGRSAAWRPTSHCASSSPSSSRRRSLRRRRCSYKKLSARA